MLACQRVFACPLAYLATCLACLLVHVSTCNVPCVPCVLTWQGILRAHIQKVSAVFFNEVKLLFSSVLNLDEKSLWNEVKARKVTRNALITDLSGALRN